MQQEVLASQRIARGAAAGRSFRPSAARLRTMGLLPESLETAPVRRGTVYLVGAGPGDPDLLTLRARELLEHADLVLYDNLSSPEVLAFASRHAERCYVGKKRAVRVFEQSAINALMVDAASLGKVVVRLKGGDPYVFGRGGEEAQALLGAGVPFEVVPGVTSALGAAAYAGMPLTHRDYTQSVTMLTGHDVDLIDWKCLASRQTLVVFMGLMSLPKIAERLIAAGLDANTHAAAVRWVTRGDQEVVVDSLAGLSAAVRERGLKPPALVIIGEIVRLRQEIDWFDKLPLRGKTVVVTRAASQSATLCRQLRRLGARVVPVPVIAFDRPSEWGPADRAIRNLPSYDWLVFTSVNGVDRFVERLDASRRDLRDLPPRICAIGPATADRIRALHLRVDLVPGEFVTESLTESFRSIRMTGRRVLIPRAEQARELLPRQLERMGSEVDVVPVYRTVLPGSSREMALAAWNETDPPDWVTVTSSSTVRNLAQLIPAGDLSRSRLASIGPVTTATAREIGLHVSAQASTYTTDGLVEAMCSVVAAERARNR